LESSSTYTINNSKIVNTFDYNAYPDDSEVIISNPYFEDIMVDDESLYQYLYIEKDTKLYLLEDIIHDIQYEYIYDGKNQLTNVNTRLRISATELKLLSTTSFTYDDNGNIIYNAFLNETPEEFIPAPHINDVLLWLETEKNIYITSIIGDTNKSIEHVGVIYYGSKYQEKIHINDNISRNEAFLKCIDYVIDNLI
jgi:hypothetical protein